MTIVNEPTTRENLLQAATDEFSKCGFDGTSVRHIERAASANRGLVGYHFGSKEALWKEVVVRQMQFFREEFAPYAHLLNLVTERERGRVLLRVYGHFVAKHPELFRILVLESALDSPRLTWLVDEFLSRTRDFFNHQAMIEGAVQSEAIAYYLMTGASSYVFSVAAQCRRMFGVDVTDERFVDRYIDFVADIDYARIFDDDDRPPAVTG